MRHVPIAEGHINLSKELATVLAKVSPQFIVFHKCPSKPERYNNCLSIRNMKALV
jgi:hypothetical protein